jgi:hypothetical protein
MADEITAGFAPHPEPVSPISLNSGQPAIDTPADAGAFVGWLVVHVWEPTERNRGIVLHWSGDQTKLFPRIASDLASLTK